MAAMKTNLFTSSKNALVFAGCIIVGTVVLVDSNSGDNMLTAATRDDNSGGDSYRRLMERKQASRGRNQEASIGSFAPDQDSNEFDDFESDVEIGDYAPPPRAGEGSSQGERRPRPGVDGPGT